MQGSKLNHVSKSSPWSPYTCIPDHSAVPPTKSRRPSEWDLPVKYNWIWPQPRRSSNARARPWQQFGCTFYGRSFAGWWQHYWCRSARCTCLENKYKHMQLIWAWISDYIYYNAWGKITYPFPHFDSATVDVWEWINSFISNFTGHIITYSCWE